MTIGSGSQFVDWEPASFVHNLSKNNITLSPAILNIFQLNGSGSASGYFFCADHEALEHRV